jgi:hypothetical protein
MASFVMDPMCWQAVQLLLTMLSSISKAIKKNQLTWEIHATGMFSETGNELLLDLLDAISSDQINTPL